MRKLWPFVLPAVLGALPAPVLGQAGAFVRMGVSARSVGLGEILDQAQQVGPRARGERLELGKTRVGQRYEPRHLHLHAAVHVAVLAHDGAQGGKFAGVTAVKRRQGGDGGQAHGPQL